MRALVEVGEVCADYQDRMFRNLRSRRLQLDETWTWIYCKEKNRTQEIALKNPDAGDIWLWSGLTRIPSWLLRGCWGDVIWRQQKISSMI
jgi:hypothetical protein